jgi:hypothetical protein
MTSRDGPLPPPFIQMITISHEDAVELHCRFGDQWQEHARGAIHGWLVRLECEERRLAAPVDLDLDAP